MEATLADCGVTATTLPAAAREALDQDGYCLLPGLAPPGWLAELRAAVEAAMAAPADPETLRRSGTRHADGLQWKDPAFDGVYLHPQVLAAVYQVLGRPFQLLFLGGRDPLPGLGLQGLHADWLPRGPGEPFHAVTAIWMLDDFRGDNGATRLVPGSHLLPRGLPKAWREPSRRHPQERVVTAAAGSVLVLNAHLWHSGTRNDSDGMRRALQCQFVSRDVARPGAPPPDPVPARLSAAARVILGLPE